MQTSGTEGSTRTSHCSCFFSWVWEHLAEVLGAASYRYPMLHCARCEPAVSCIAGVSTGSVYKDVALMKNGFPGESVANGSVIAVKTHEWGAAGRQQFAAAILLIRDPFASILAEFNRRWKGWKRSSEEC